MEQRLIDANDLINNAMAKTFGLRICDIDDAQTILTIPDNPTNGDMIKAMFPYIEIKDNCDMYYSVNIENLSIDKGLNTVGFRKDWWNAPYKDEVSR